MPHLTGRLISIKYAAFCNRENIAKFLIYEEGGLLYSLIGHITDFRYHDYEALTFPIPASL